MTPHGDIDLCQHWLRIPSHYLIQCWFINNAVLWHSPRITPENNQCDAAENCTSEINATSPRGQWFIRPDDAYIGRLVGIVSVNGWSLVRHQAVTRANADLLSMESLATIFIEISIKIKSDSLKRSCVWKHRWQNVGHLCLGLNELTHWGRVKHTCVSKLYHHWFR